MLRCLLALLPANLVHFGCRLYLRVSCVVQLTGGTHEYSMTVTIYEVQRPHVAPPQQKKGGKIVNSLPRALHVFACRCAARQRQPSRRLRDPRGIKMYRKSLLDHGTRRSGCQEHHTPRDLCLLSSA